METKLLFPILIFLAFLCYQKPSQIKPAVNSICISVPIKSPRASKNYEPYLPMAVNRSGWENIENILLKKGGTS